MDSGELVPLDPGLFRLTETGVVVTGEPSFAEWAGALRQARQWGGAIAWVIGDLLSFGHCAYGEDYSQELDHADETLRVYQWVAERFPPVSRLTGPHATFSHHQEVAGLEPAAAQALLRQSVEEGWSRNEIRKRARTKKNEAPAFDLDAEKEFVAGWLSGRRDTWPEGDRRSFWEFVAALAARPTKPVRADMEAFARFWEAYPRKTAKQDAVKAWKRLAPAPELVETLLASLERQKQSRQWRDGVQPHPATWLNGRRWEDELPAANGTSNGRPRPETTAEKIARIRREQAARDEF